MSISLLAYVYLLPLCLCCHKNDNVSDYVHGDYSYLHWGGVVEDKQSHCCAFIWLLLPLAWGRLAQ